MDAGVGVRRVVGDGPRQSGRREKGVEAASKEWVERIVYKTETEEEEAEVFNVYPLIVHTKNPAGRKSDYTKRRCGLHG